MDAERRRRRVRVAVALAGLAAAATGVTAFTWPCFTYQSGEVLVRTSRKLERVAAVDEHVRRTGAVPGGTGQAFFDALHASGSLDPRVELTCNVYWRQTFAVALGTKLFALSSAVIGTPEAKAALDATTDP